MILPTPDLPGTQVLYLSGNSQDQQPRAASGWGDCKGLCGECHNGILPPRRQHPGLPGPPDGTCQTSLALDTLCSVSGSRL